MRFVSYLAAFLGLPIIASAPTMADSPHKPAVRPNILVIVADDLGYSDIGAFGGEIATPNLDGLARKGVRLTNFYTAPACSPTRAMLLTGKDHHIVGVGTMFEQMTAELSAAGYVGELRPNTVTVAKRLQDSGYFTALSGKWHLGLEAEKSPKAFGFTRSFALLPGGGNHFGRDQEGEPYGFRGGRVGYREDGVSVHYPVGSYSSDVFTNRMIGFLGEAKSLKQPFFGYLTFTAPHWPLQAPDDVIDRYKGRYDDGPEALRQRRLARLNKLGLIDQKVRPHDFIGVKGWSQLSTDQRAALARRQEVYAAMVDRMDENIGRVIAALKTSGQYDNTIIFFLSDNGGDGSSQERWATILPPAVSGAPTPIPLDNRQANIGREGSYVSLGKGWGQASTAPSRFTKSTVAEGGIHAPAFVTGAGINGGRISDALVHVMDITPTLSDLAGLNEPDKSASIQTSRIHGKSWKAILTRKKSIVRSETDFLFWELFYGRAVRQGSWKAVWLSPNELGGDGPSGGRWELFNVKSDPGETQNLAAQAPKRLEQLIKAWDAYAKDVGVVTSPPSVAKPMGG
jgi:arylsulfatase A-like enzyme